jgi:hypothetical protein
MLEVYRAIVLRNNCAPWWWKHVRVSGFYALSQNCEKRLLASLYPSVCPSVLPSAWNTRLTLDRFSWNLIFDCFSKICRENSSLTKMRQEKRILYMKINIHSWSYLPQFFSEWENFQTKFEEKIMTYVQWCFSENRTIHEVMWKSIVERGGTHTIWRKLIACWYLRLQTRSRNM